jgi:hypothetical protein
MAKTDALHGMHYGPGIAAARKADADAQLLSTIRDILAESVPDAADPLQALAVLIRRSQGRPALWGSESPTSPTVRPSSAV